MSRPTPPEVLGEQGAADAIAPGVVDRGGSSVRRRQRGRGALGTPQREEAVDA
jgi:hypothetical protein